MLLIHFTGTNFSVQGRPGTKWIYIYLITLKIFRKNDKTSFYCFRTSFPVLKRRFLFLEHPLPVLECPFLLCLVLSRRTGRDRLSKSCIVPSHIPPSWILTGCPGLSCPLARFCACPFVLKSWTIPSRWNATMWYKWLDWKLSKDT